jgi:hypothetical protein
LLACVSCMWIFFVLVEFCLLVSLSCGCSLLCLYFFNVKLFCAHV